MASCPLTLHSACAGSVIVINGSVLKTFNPVTFLICKEQELHIDLDAVAGHFLFVSLELLHRPEKPMC